MEIIIGKTAGFCYGVRNAVTKTEEKLEEYKDISCLGELVHNGEVIKKLENMGLKTIENIEEANNRVIIRAHGVPKETYKKAEQLGLQVFDFTCPSVLKTHTIEEEYAKKDYFIFFIGNKKHPETIGTASFCGKNHCIVETEDDIDEAVKSFKKSMLNKLFILAQTTFSLEKFNKYIEIIDRKIDININMEFKNTICNATKIRQEETEKLSKEVQCMIIIGGKNSSNTKKLYEIAKENCENSFIVENEKELDIDEIKNFSIIGIMAGASTPDESIDNVVMTLNQVHNLMNI